MDTAVSFRIQRLITVQHGVCVTVRRWSTYGMIRSPECQIYLRPRRGLVVGITVHPPWCCYGTDDDDDIWS